MKLTNKVKQLNHGSETGCPGRTSTCPLNSYTRHVCNQNREWKEHGTKGWQIYQGQFWTRRHYVHQQPCDFMKALISLEACNVLFEGLDKQYSTSCLFIWLEFLSSIDYFTPLHRKFITWFWYWQTCMFVFDWYFLMVFFFYFTKTSSLLYSNSQIQGDWMQGSVAVSLK